ncbi:MAG: hypothetical protein QHH14_11220, partial [Clostridiales bacterium]|nr:hypothetical protein [Clostridiales bacterium]
SANMNFTHAGRMATVSPADSEGIAKFITRSSYLSNLENIYNDIANFEHIWLLNRSISEAYGLSPDDLEYILSTFPVFARKRPEFFAYLQNRIAEWKAEDRAPKPIQKPYPIPSERKVQVAAESRREYRKRGSGEK